MSYNFDGNNDWIGNTTTAPATSIPITMACWFYRDTGNDGHLINICNSSGEDGLRMSVQPLGSVRINSVDNGNGLSLVVNTTANSSLQTWSHACGIFESSTNRSVYLNGDNETSDKESSNPTGFSRLHIGSRRNNSTTDTFFDGKISEVGVWNVALVPSEIRALADGIACYLIRPQNLIFYAPLIRDLVDISKTNIALTNNGGATVDDHSRVYL